MAHARGRHAVGQAKRPPMAFNTSRDTISLCDLPQPRGSGGPCQNVIDSRGKHLDIRAGHDMALLGIAHKLASSRKAVGGNDRTVEGHGFQHHCRRALRSPTKARTHPPWPASWIRQANIRASPPEWRAQDRQRAPPMRRGRAPPPRCTIEHQDSSPAPMRAAADQTAFDDAAARPRSPRRARPPGALVWARPSISGVT